MKICERAINWVQIINAEGDVRLCGWFKDGGVIGNLKQNSLHEIYHSKAAEKIREKLIKEDYSSFEIDACPYLALQNESIRKEIEKEVGQNKLFVWGLEELIIELTNERLV